jgi:uncharacterized membrane protein YcgQ (UPF0703/DUF1980 family)
MSHTHQHGHNHGHDHQGDDYFIDQLCLIAISGAFGAICLMMYLWNTAYLSRILAPQFYPFVLWSGVTLTVLFVIRAVVVWRQAGESVVDHGHQHTHEHVHDHDHEQPHNHDHHHDHHHDHEHAHEHGHGAETHHHEHGHEHEHLHTDFTPAYPTSAEDHGHEHAFAPWRYVVLIVPIFLFFLDLPREKKPKAETKVDRSQEIRRFGTVILAANNPLNTTAMLSSYFDQIDPKDVLRGVNFKELEAASYTTRSREEWEGKTVEVLGQYAPNRQDDHYFGLVRFRIQCCGADALQLNVIIVCNDPVTKFQQGQWVNVVGRVEFHMGPSGRYVTVLRVPKESNIEPAQTPANPYVQ